MVLLCVQAASASGRSGNFPGCAGTLISRSLAGSVSCAVARRACRRRQLSSQPRFILQARRAPRLARPALAPRSLLLLIVHRPCCLCCRAWRTLEPRARLLRGRPAHTPRHKVRRLRGFVGAEAGGRRRRGAALRRGSIARALQPRRCPPAAVVDGWPLLPHALGSAARCVRYLSRVLNACLPPLQVPRSNPCPAAQPAACATCRGCWTPASTCCLTAGAAPPTPWSTTTSWWVLRCAVLCLPCCAHAVLSLCCCLLLVGWRGAALCSRRGVVGGCCAASPLSAISSLYVCSREGPCKVSEPFCCACFLCRPARRLPPPRRSSAACAHSCSSLQGAWSCCARCRPPRRAPRQRRGQRAQTQRWQRAPPALLPRAAQLSPPPAPRLTRSTRTARAWRLRWAPFWC